MSTKRNGIKGESVFFEKNKLVFLSYRIDGVICYEIGTNLSAVDFGIRGEVIASRSPLQIGYC
jgi:hypothetical protein